ncbi:LPD7 domain-containing protein [Paucibacter sp. JuS9]|uniref:LPD7 domain-containing protein n=1 Tax=Roseateles TaxID=93681 RepID=UPI002FE59E0B
MDEDHSLHHRSAPIRGGSVEPANRAAIAKERFQTPHPERGEHFEFRDPFFDVTYRAKTFDEMTAKAEQMGASRFTAIDAKGARTQIQKVNGDWQRGEPLPALTQRPSEPMTTRDDVPDASANPMTGSAAAQRSPLDKAMAMATAKVVARIDAKAERAAMVARIESSLSERYVIKRAPVMVGDMKIGSTEYRFRGDSSRVAFTESTFRLATDTNSPSVARSMVDLAQARDWKGLRVSGAEDFRRMVWLESTLRGVKAVGYEPNLADMEVLKREREARQTNRIEPARDAGTANATTANEKSSVRGGGRKAMIAAIDAVLIAKKVPEAKRQAVLTAASEQLTQRSRSTALPKIKVYDRTAQRQLPITPPAPDLNRAQDRAALSRSR